MSAGPVHQLVEVVGGSLLAKDLRVLLGSLPTHRALYGSRDERGTTGCLAGGDGVVEEGDHLIGELHRERKLEMTEARRHRWA